MENNIEITRYIHYTTEDFLQDDFFTTSMSFPTGESERFWQEFLQQPDITPGYFLEAKEIATSLLRYYRTSFTAEDADSLWERIENNNLL